MPALVRRLLLGAGVALLAVAMIALGGLLSAGGPSSADSSTSAARQQAGSVGRGGSTPGGVAGLQAHLERVPGDWPAWATLGGAYIEQARRTGDPTLYPKAQDAFTRSLQVRPEGNAPALTGQASLAAARHDFPAALRLATQAVTVDSYAATAYGIQADALVELGRYDEAAASLQRMVELQPGSITYSRISYLRELHGDVEGARAALQRAYDSSFAPANRSFAAHYLGELAWNTGDLDAAARWYDVATSDDPSYLPPLSGQARVAAARGQNDEALRLYATLVDRLPLPQYAIEYGELLQSLGRTEEAQQQYDLVAAENSLLRNNGVAVDQEVAVYDADHGRGKQALAEAEAATAYRDGVFTEDALGWAMHAVGRDAEALQHAEKAMALGTKNPLLSYHRGMIRAALGDTDGARDDLATALRLNPHFNSLQAPIAQATLAALGGPR